MRLTTIQVTKFRNILDSSPIRIEPDVTCLVGKNESGKTALLQALYRLRPARPNVQFSIHEEYPAWLEKRDRLAGQEIEKHEPISAVFELEEEDILAAEEEFGKGAIDCDSLTLSCDYNDESSWELSVNEKAIIKNWLSKFSPSKELASAMKGLDDVESLKQVLEDWEKKEEEKETETGDKEEETNDAAKAIKNSLEEMLDDGDLSDVVFLFLEPRIPKFFYYNEYSTLPYSLDIRKLLTSDPTTLDDNELTARTLLQLAAADKDYLLNPDYERRKRELENVANSLTQDVLEYWSTNPELRVQPDITQVQQTVPGGQDVVVDKLKIRIWDQRHLLSLPFDEHSTGFRWFFSFLAAFAEYEFKEEPVIILLDEPALGLHARAQKDFLRFIEERLAPKQQVLYTTHSPFMVEPGKLERVRLVEDKGKEDGAVVSEDVLSTDTDTLFPLQGALGYDLVQHLFIAPNNLVVEGTSDFTYLIVISDFLREKEMTHLDERWSIVPVGGADFVPAFVALLGTHLDVTVLVDAQKAGHQRLSHLASLGYLKEKRIITVGDVLGRKLADIEDVFEVEDYLDLYNRAFALTLKHSDLKGTDPIVNRINRHQGIDRFDHGRPADVLLRCRDEILPKLGAKTLARFQKLFDRINSTLPKGKEC